MVHENVSLVVSRQILSELCNHIPNMNVACAKQVSHFVLEKLQPRAISFEEQVRRIFQFFFFSIFEGVNHTLD